MDLAVVAVGKLRPYYRNAADDYLRRLRRYTTPTEHEVREASRAPTVAVQRAEEAARLETRIVESSTVVALAREGTGWSSRELARQLERWQLAGRPVSLVIGGSAGLDAPLMARADARWSLGPLTFPHELARIIVLEQVYRAFTILRGEPYHKGV
ncbi:MAG TPA: 23S rRNA (pseudouridine(1915)-N(3))-methyltransferase RlmH [Gemmatimonadales bacterium]|nr:23S rRNA (pseudouridine(1915)-N(3))-methyltransferase RlmH [Gemmatimonadales bacterium]